MKVEAIKVAERTSDGGFKQHYTGCDFCKRNHTIVAFLSMNDPKYKVKICKTCMCEAIQEIDKKILED